MPSMRVICVPVSAKAANRKVTSRAMGMSRRRLERVTATGAITAVRPRMSRVLNTLEPTTLPTEMSAFPCRAPVRLTTSSGQLVPKPTMVRPMTNSLMPALRAMADEPSTSQSAPNTISARPSNSNKTCSIMLLLPFQFYPGGRRSPHDRCGGTCPPAARP